MKHLRNFIACTLAIASASIVAAQDAEDIPTIKLDNSTVSSPNRTLSVREQRQLIAQEKSRQRRARLEAHAWNGHQPLRPVATDMPFMRSNYVYRYYRQAYVPYYIYR